MNHFASSFSTLLAVCVYSYCSQDQGFIRQTRTTWQKHTSLSASEKQAVQLYTVLKIAQCSDISHESDLRHFTITAWVKAVHVQTTRVYGGRGVVALLIRNVGTKWRRVMRVTPPVLHPVRKNPLPGHQFNQLARPNILSEDFQVEKNLLYPRRTAKMYLNHTTRTKLQRNFFPSPRKKEPINYSVR